MTGGRVLIGEVFAAADDLDAARLQRRAALLSRTGGGTLIAPVLADERVLFPGVRHIPVRVAPGLSRDRVASVVADEVGELLDALRPRLVHCVGLATAIPAILRRRPSAAVIVEPGILPSQWLRDHEPKTPPERMVDLVELEDKTLTRADAVVVRSNIEAATLVRRGVTSEKLHTARDGLPMGVDVGELPGMPHVLCICDCEPWSAWGLPMEALVRIKTPWRLTMVVPADAPGGQIEAHARALHVSERVTVSRDPSLENVVSRLDAAQLVICALSTSRSVEAGSVVPAAVLWALAAGRPLLAPDLPVVRAYAGPGAAYYSTGDAGSLAARLGPLMESVDAREALAEAALGAAESLDWSETEQPVADLWSVLG